MSVFCPFCGNETEFMTTTQVASLLGVTDGRVRQLVRKGRFPGSVLVEGVHKTGMWRIPASAVLPLVSGRDDELQDA